MMSVDRSVAILMWSVVWDCLWFWELKELMTNQEKVGHCVKVQGF